MNSLRRILAIACLLTLGPGLIHSHPLSAQPAGYTIPVRDLNLWRNLGWLPEDSARTVALGPGGKRLYIGLHTSYRPGLDNLVVFTLQNGRTAGLPRYYRVNDEPLPVNNHHTVDVILVNEKERKLYLGSRRDGATRDTATHMLGVYDLDAEGEPRGAGRFLLSGNVNNHIRDLVLHPTLPYLYMVGWGGAGIYRYRLDDAGWPEGEPETFPVNGHGKYQIAISPDGSRAYLGTYHEKLEIVDLDETGKPRAAARVVETTGEEAYLTFAYTPQALYLVRKTPGGERLAVWPLQPDGLPRGLPEVLPDVPTSVVRAAQGGQGIWIAADQVTPDAFSGEPIYGGSRPGYYPVLAGGKLGPLQAGAISSRPWPFPIQRGLALNVNADNAPVLLTKSFIPAKPGNLTKGYRLRVTILEAREKSRKTLDKVTPHLLFSTPYALEKLAEIPVGQPTAWLELDKNLRDQRGALAVVVLANTTYVAVPMRTEPTAVEHLKIRLEVAQGDPAAGGRLLKTMEETVIGEGAGFILPGYGTPAAEREGLINSFSGHSERYLAQARAVGLKPEERPRLFPISPFHLMGGSGSVEQLRNMANAMGMLGYNTINAYHWGAIPTAQVDQILDTAGLRRRSLAVYNPPSYFAYDRDKMSPEALRQWAREQLDNVEKFNGGTRDDLAWQILSDEPGWYFPVALNEVREHPGRLEIFRAYLRGKKLTPAEVGANDWGEVFPVGAGVGAVAGANLSQRRLYYWTIRFFCEQASAGHRLVQEALDQVAGRPVLTPVNWNNWGNRWYTPSPNVKIANNTVIGPDTAYGMFDWFESGRRDAHTLWTEDWLRDQDAQVWSLYGDMLRSATIAEEKGAVDSQQEFGSYVIGGMTGEQPDGPSYKILSLLGHGAKAVDMYTFGPNFLFADGWSEHLPLYQPIASALRLVGRAERLLYPGRPARGKVAIHSPAESQLWDREQRLPLYFHENWSLHYALMHEGYTVDFVDSHDLEAGVLGERGYTTLYLNGPNLSVAAQQKTADWVRNGGTLVATPGAATADELNQPTTFMDKVLGLQRRSAVRDVPPAESEWERQPVTATLQQVDQRFGPARELRGPIAALKPAAGRGASVLASTNTGEALLTAATYGRGRALAYGFFPGWQYWLSPNRNDLMQLPQGWSAPARQMAIAPVVIARTPRPVVASAPGVEVCRLDSPRGTALVVLNWFGTPLPQLHLTIPGGGRWKKATSAQGSALKVAGTGDKLEISLPLRTVDVLMVE